MAVRIYKPKVVNCRDSLPKKTVTETFLIVMQRIIQNMYSFRQQTLLCCFGSKLSSLAARTCLTFLFKLSTCP